MQIKRSVGKLGALGCTIGGVTMASSGVKAIKLAQAEDKDIGLLLFGGTIAIVGLLVMAKMSIRRR